MIGIGLLLGAAGILIHDLYVVLRSRGEGEPGPRHPLHWKAALRLAVAGCVPLLAGISICVVPSGDAGVLLSQFGGARPEGCTW